MTERVPLPFRRELVHLLRKRIDQRRNFIQVVLGPRQVGKTTAVHQVLEHWSGASHYSTADLPAPPQPFWIEQQWQTARLRAAGNQPVVLVLDEVQKVSRWSEVVKRLWDEDARLGNDIRVIVLGSSSLLVQAISGLKLSDWQQDSTRWGRLVEVAVGAHLINSSLGTAVEVYYWRDHDREVDFALRHAGRLLAVEVKSGRFKGKHSGFSAFTRKFPQAKTILVGNEGIPVKEFISQPASTWFSQV